MPEPEIAKRDIPTSWVGMESVPIQMVNAVLTQVDDMGDVIISFGQTTPPLIVGDPEQQRQILDRIAYIPVHPIARFTMSRDRLEQTIGFLDQLRTIQDNYLAIRRRISEQT